jgi:hypothetical protein
MLMGVALAKLSKAEPPVKWDVNGICKSIVSRSPFLFFNGKHGTKKCLHMNSPRIGITARSETMDLTGINCPNYLKK